MIEVAALFVELGGVYYGLAGVDPWPERRDAREYRGPHPVVAHPPCARWGRYWFGGPSARARLVKGDDGGCFSSALRSVRTWGGVLEHPEGSAAWRHFKLTAPPRAGGWVRADALGGWTCCVEQGHYGHRARKRTWLYAIGVKTPSLRWGDCGKTTRWSGEYRPERRPSRRGFVHYLSHRERAATPHQFRDLLLALARGRLTGTTVRR